MSVRYSCNCPTFKRGDGYGISEEELDVRPTTVKSVHQRNELILFLLRWRIVSMFRMWQNLGGR
jgi:hypothetical protein